MGRYYNGDIEGKFWFGLQGSNAASRFGGQECEPSYINYFFSEDDLNDVNKELERIETDLGSTMEVLNKFFEDCHGYNDDDLKEIGVTNNKLLEYADYLLGVKIRDSIIENGQCSFDAEL
jgi:hypothetical protein